MIDFNFTSFYDDLQHVDSPRRGVYMVFNVMADLIAEGCWDTIDVILALVEPGDLPDEISLAVPVLLTRSRNRLPHYDKYVKQLRDHIASKNSPEQTELLLKGIT